MIYEERDYRIKAGRLGEFVKAYGELGLPLQKKHLGRFIAYFTTEIGELDHVVALWGYDTLGDREARRRAMQSDPEWQGYVDRIRNLVDGQTSRMLDPIPYAPLQ